MRRVCAMIAGLLAVLLGATPALAGTRIEGVPSFGHVFLIIGENTDYSHVNSTNTPYLMGSVRPHAAWFDNYYSATHWSQANYVAMVSGQYTDCEQNDGGIACRQDVDNLYHRLDLAGMSWKVWLEAGSAKCDTGSGGSCSSDVPCPQTGFYTTGNPPIVFDDISSSECVAN